MRRLFPNDDPIHLNLDALMPEGQHTPTSLHKSLTAPPAADAQPQTSPGPEVLQAPPNAAMYSGLLAVIKPYAEDPQKWDVWTEEEDSSMTEEDAQVLEHILCFCMNVGRQLPICTHGLRGAGQKSHCAVYTLNDTAVANAHCSALGM